MTPGHPSRGRRSRIAHRGLWIVGLMLWLLPPNPAAAQSRKPTEFEVKAAYLFNFAKFVKWPGSTESVRDAFSICVLGEDPFGTVLDSTVSGEQVEGKKVAVRRIHSVSEAAKCRIVFVSSSEQGRLTTVLTALAKSPVLTVSDIDGFADRSGMIQFVMEHDRVRFQVNLTAAEKAGLTMSSELLKVAVAVKREGQSGE